MDKDALTTIVALVAAIVGLATLSVILSKNANTAGVISASTTGLSQLINAAVSPINGGGLSTAVSPLSSAATNFGGGSDLSSVGSEFGGGGSW